MTISTLSAAPHPPFGHLLPVKTRGEGDTREGVYSPSPRLLRGEGGSKGRMRGSAKGSRYLLFIGESSPLAGFAS
jgi:hypothetical protein